MSNNAAVTQTTNIVPVQGIFQPEPTFALISLIGPAGTPFYANISPNQSGLNITNSTINSTTIGATTPSTGAFTSGTVAAAPTGPTDLVNKQYVDFYAAGLSWKQPVAAASMGNLTLSGLQTVDGVSLAAGDTVLVKNQSTAANNGIYVVASGAWTRSPGADTWNEFLGAIVFVVGGSQAGSAWYCTAQPGGTLGVTAINWSNFSVSSTYTAGTGLTLTGTQFSITPVGAAGTYGSASSVPVFVTNASGQVSSVTNTSIAIANTQVSGLGTMSTQNANAVAITGGTINGTTVGASTAAAVTGTTITANTQFTGPGTGLTGTASGLSIGGNAATATSATTATNLAGGAAGSLPYQSATSTTTFLAAGTNGQILTLAAGVPAWTNAPATGVTTFSAGTTGFTPSSATSGAVTLAGTLNVANGGTGVTTSSGANSVVLRDANNNITANAYFNGFTSVAASGSTITLTVASTPVYLITGSGGQVIQLPNATTLSNGTIFSFNNNQSSGAITVNNNSGSLIVSVPSGGYTTVVLLSNATAAGSWDRHDQTPANVSWSTNTLDYPGSITSATWNGNAIAINRGGTNGTATPTAGAVAYGTGTAYAFTAAGTAGYVLTSNGSSAPTWSAAFSGLSITDDTTTNATRYLTFTSATTGSITGANVASTKLSINPSTGILSVTGIASPAITNQLATTIRETATVSATAATGTINYDTLTQTVLYYTTNASGNWTVNFRGNSGTTLDSVMSTGQSLSATFLVTQGSTAYYNSAVTIDGNSVTPKWQGGTAPTSGNASSVDTYTYVIVKTGSATFTVLASQTKFA
jgi:hypothetical protein